MRVRTIEGDDVAQFAVRLLRPEYETAIDYNYRFRQYMQNFNDRASYALACAIDGICPVNFKKQVNL